jgi:hypothetical protein
MKRLILISALLLTSSCSLFRARHCNPEGAMKLGKQDANAWDSNMKNYNKGESCDYDDYVKANYRSDYMNAYNLAIKENCKSTNIMSIAKSDALAGNSNFPNLEKLGLCSKAGISFSKAESTYMTSFKKNFCKDSTVKKIAKRDANRTKAMGTDQFDKVCKSSRFAKVYKKTYLAAFSGVVTEQAKKDVASDRPRNTDFIEELVRSSSLQKKFRSAYKKAYNKEVYAKLRKRISTQAENDGKNYKVANVEFIENSHATNSQKPKLIKSYNSIYMASLKKACTVTKVMTLAKEDARSKKGVENGMDKINNCPKASGQATLISSYVKNFNQEKDKMQLEEQRRQLQAEKRKLEAEKARLARQNSKLQQQNARLANQRLHDAQWRSGIVNFKHEKKPIRTACQVRKKNYRVTVYNKQGASMNLSSFDKWELVIRDFKGRIVKTKEIDSPNKYISFADKKKTLNLRRSGAKKQLKKEYSCTALLLKH